MTAENRSRWFYSLRVKLVVVLVALLVISTLLAMVDLSKFLTVFFQHTAEQDTVQLGKTVELALRQSMLRRPDLALNESLADVGKAPSIRRVWVINKEGQVAHASDLNMVGQVLNRNENPICNTCHSSKAAPETRTLFTKDERGASILRHVRTIVNEPACWGCHDSRVRLNGILLLEKSTEPFQAAIGSVQRRLAMTGGITVAALAIMTLLVTTFLVGRPVRRLMAGVRQLGTGDLTVRVPVRGRDELGVLAAGFNGMVDKLEGNLEEILNKNAELSMVYAIVERLTKSINLGELKEVILHTLEDVLGADRVVLLSNLGPQGAGELLMKTRDVTRLHRGTYTPEGECTLPDGFPSELASRWLRGELKEPLLAVDRRVAAVPVRASDGKMALLLIRRERPFGFEANPKLLRALASHMAVAFENARLYTMAITDELTELFSVRHFQNRVEEAIARYKHQGQKFSLMMLDLDLFKSVNDEFGHPAGDTVLRHIARVVLRTVRVRDTCYRYGGEEFAVLLPETDPLTARGVAERVRREIESLRITLAHGKEIAVTVSIGVATCPENGVNAKELVAAADAALYKAKSEGRNRVCDSARQG